MAFFPVLLRRRLSQPPEQPHMHESVFLLVAERACI